MNSDDHDSVEQPVSVKIMPDGPIVLKGHIYTVI